MKIVKKEYYIIIKTLIYLYFGKASIINEHSVTPYTMSVVTYLVTKVVRVYKENFTNMMVIIY